jgi:hypothetical protein
MQALSVDDLARSFERHLRAQNKSPRTVECYLEAISQFSAYFRAHRKAHGGRGLGQAHGEDIEEFIIDLLGRCKASTANNAIAVCTPSTAGSRTRSSFRIRCEAQAARGSGQAGAGDRRA